MKKLLSYAVAALTAGSLAVPESRAQGLLTPGVAYVFYTTSATDKIPHVNWRVASAFSAGLASFLFDVRVLKKLPAERLEATLKADVDTISSSHYLKRLLISIERALLAEAAKIHAEHPDEDFNASFESIIGKSTFACELPSCGVLELKKLVSLMIPPEAAAYWTGDAEAKALKTLIDNLPQARIYGYAAGEGETRMGALPSLMRRRKYDVSCAVGKACVGKGKGEG